MPHCCFNAPSKIHYCRILIESLGCASRSQATGFTTAKSDALMDEARKIMPGGVSSPVRAFKSVGGEPVVFDKVKGSKAWDVDGNEYVDYVGTWGPAIVGHADDRVLDAIKETMDKGTSFGAPCALENELAKVRKRCDPREVTPRAALPFVRTLARRCSSNA